MVYACLYGCFGGLRGLVVARLFVDGCWCLVVMVLVLIVGCCGM